MMTLAWLNSCCCNESMAIIGTIVGLSMAVLYAFPFGFMGYDSTALLVFLLGILTLVVWQMMPHPPKRNHTMTTQIPRAITIKRILWAAIAWGLSSVTVYITFFGFSSPLRSHELLDIGSFIAWLPNVAAWIFLAIMTIAWIRNRRCHPLVPIIGTSIGLPCAISEARWLISIPFYISTVLLAFYLVYWHLWTADNPNPAQ